MKIKIKIIICFLVPIFAIQSYAQREKIASQIQEKNARSLALAIADTNLVIGVFEVPSLNGRLRSLKSGVIPETQNGYLDLLIKKDLIKLNLITAIKGDFDSLIFIRRPNIELNPEKNSPQHYFYPISGTIWLIILKGNRNTIDSIHKWVNDIEVKKADSYINTKTTFSLFEPYVTICLKWTNELERPIGLEMETIDLVRDITEIIRYLNNNARDTSDISKDKHHFFDSLVTFYGKSIAKEIFK